MSASLKLVACNKRWLQRRFIPNLINESGKNPFSASLINKVIMG